MSAICWLLSGNLGDRQHRAPGFCKLAETVWCVVKPSLFLLNALGTIMKPLSARQAGGEGQR